MLYPAIAHHWKKYQKQMIQEIKEKEAVIAGDGRHDSMGHSAKYCAYMLFNFT